MLAVAQAEVSVEMLAHDDRASGQRCILPRAGRAEVKYFAWGPEGLMLTDEPDDPKDEQSANARMMMAVKAAFKLDEPVVWRPSLGSESTFYRFKKWAIARKFLVQANGQVYVPAGGVTLH